MNILDEHIGNICLNLRPYHLPHSLLIISRFFFAPLAALAFSCCLVLNAKGAEAGELKTGELKVAVASNFSQSLEEIAALYLKTTGQIITISPGSSGKLYGQIRAGAPFDMFFSADQEKPRLLVSEDRALPDSLFTYAQGRLVLWSNSDAAENVEQSLKTHAFKKLAFANPKIAPYGKASLEVLDALGLSELTKKRWVMGENISQTFQFIYSGAVDLGFVSLSQLYFFNLKAQPNLVLEGNNPSIWLIPEAHHSPILQDAVILKRTNNLAQANAFFDFFQQGAVKKMLYEHGYNTSN